MSDSTAIDKKAARVERALARRYPGVSVSVCFHDNPSFKGWGIRFTANNPESLIRHGLASAPSDFVGLDGESITTEFVSCRWRNLSTRPDQFECWHHIAEEEVGKSRRWNGGLTKKMQAQVMRMLKPFIRGTWQAPAVQ